MRLTLPGRKQVTVSLRSSFAVREQHKREDNIYNRLLDIEDTVENDCLGYQTGKSEDGDVIIIGFKKTNC